MATDPRVTISILNWNGRNFLEQFLPSVVATTYSNYRIQVVDNDSSDDSLEFLQQHYPQVEILELDDNYGFAEGYNRAISSWKDPYVVLLNSDVEVSPNWLDPLVKWMEAHPKAAAVQPKIKAFHQKDHFEYAGAAGGFIDRYAYPFCRGRIFDTLEADENQYQQSLPVFWATGACMMLRRSVVAETGLFESYFFAHMEEIDFCWRVQNLGHEIGVEPQSEVYHVGGGTLPQGNPRKTFLNVRNSLIMLHTNVPAGQVFRRVVSRLILDGVWAARQIIGGDFKTAGAISRAHWAYFGTLRRWNRRRRHIYRAGLPIDWPQNGMLPGSIVWAYFAQGKKRWSQLFGEK